MNEKSQIPKRETRYTRILKLIHKDIPTYIPFLLIMKLYFTKNTVFYLASYFFRYTGILIRCANFSITVQQVKLNKTISKVIRNFSSYKIIQILEMDNQSYNKSCFIILAFFLYRHILYLILYIQLKKAKKKNTLLAKIKPFKTQILLDHFVFIAYPFIIEHLSFIYYIKWLSKYFYLKDDGKSPKMNLFLCFMNAILIIAYNFDGYLHIVAVNRPYDDKGSPVKYRYSNIKFWIIFLLQNFCTIEALALFLKGMVLRVFKFVMIIFFFLLFLILYFSSLHNYNYQNVLNSFIELISGFSFFSLVIEVICCIFNYNVLTQTHLLYMTCGKFMVSFLFFFVSDSITAKFMFNFSKVELFKINKEITNRSSYDVFLFIYLNLRDIYEKEDPKKIRELLTIIYMHKERCNKESCKCKLIHISPYGKKYKKEFIKNLIERISFLLETAFVEIDYTNDYEITLLMSENYYFFHKNPLMAYSLIQTLLHLQYKKLSISQLLNLFEVSQKYIDNLTELTTKKLRDIYNKEDNSNRNKNNNNNQKKNNNTKNENNNNNNQQIIEHNKGVEMSEMFLLLNKVNKIQKTFYAYSENFMTILRSKFQFNTSLKIETYKDNLGEVSNINCMFLNSKNVSELMELLKKEIKYKRNITKYISLLETNNLPLEFLYRSLLFYYYFFGGVLEEEIVPILYSFTNDHNLYSSKIKIDIFNILLLKFQKSHSVTHSSFDLIFTCTKGIKCKYICSSLVEFLQYKYDDIHNLDLESFFPKYLAHAHTTHILRHLILNQKQVCLQKEAFFFCSNGHLFKAVFSCGVIAGLSKNLTFFVSTHLIEKKREYYFLLNQNCELFSLSENFYKEYGISLRFLEKYQISFLDLFGIKPETLRKKNIKFNQALNDYKIKLKIVPGEYYSKKLFKNTKENSKKENSIYFLTNYLENNSNNFNYKSEYNNRNYNEESELNNNNEEGGNDYEGEEEERNAYGGLIMARKQIEDIYNEIKIINDNIFKMELKASKINFINKLSYSIKELNDVDTHDQSYVLIEKMISKYRDLYSNINDSFGNIETQKADMDKNNFFELSFRIDLLYDTPFYVLKVREIILNSRLLNMHTIEPEIINSNNKTNSISTTDNKKKLYFTEDSRTITTVSNDFPLMADNPVKNEEHEKHSLIYNQKCLKVISFFFYVLLLLLLSIYIIILIYQRRTVDISKSLFLSLYYNFYQRDSYLQLFSIYISTYYYYMNLTKVSLISDFINTKHFQIILEGKSDFFEENYHNFYINYVDFNEKAGYSIKGIFDEFYVEKLYIGWEAGKYLSDYLTEVQFLSYSSKLISLPNLENNNTEEEQQQIKDILEDSNLYLLAQYEDKNYTYNRVNSDYIKVLYYLTSNGEKFISKFDYLKQSIESSYNDFSNNAKNIYLLLEAFGFVFSIIFFILIYYYLEAFNTIIFTNIIKLFVIDETISVYKHNEITKKENYYLFKVIKEFHTLLIDFNITNIKNFDMAKKFDINSSIDKMKTGGYFDDIDNEDINNNSLENKKNSSNKTNEKNEKNKNFKNSRIKNSSNVVETLLSRKTNDKSKISISTSNLVNNPGGGQIGYIGLGLKNKNQNENNNNNTPSEETYNTNTNSNATNTNSNSTNRNRNNLIIKSNKIKNVRFMGGAEKNKNTPDESLSDYKISITVLLKKLKSTIMLEIKIIAIFMGFCFVVIGFVLIYKLIVSLQIYSNITEHFSDFQVVMYQYTYIFNFYDNLLTLLVLPKFANTSLLESMSKIKEEESFKKKDFVYHRIKNYIHFNELYSQITDSYEKTNKTKIYFLICDKNEEENNKNSINDKLKNDLCYQVISSNYTLFDKDLNIGIDAMVQEMTNIYKDYVTISGGIKSKEDINFYFDDSSFIKLYVNINFVIHKIQDIFYRAFLVDQSSLNNSMNQKIIFYNLFCMIFIGFILIVVLFFIDGKIKSLNNMIIDSTNRITIAFKNIMKINN